MILKWICWHAHRTGIRLNAQPLEIGNWIWCVPWLFFFLFKSFAGSQLWVDNQTTSHVTECWLNFHFYIHGLVFFFKRFLFSVFCYLSLVFSAGSEKGECWVRKKKKTPVSLVRVGVLKQSLSFTWESLLFDCRSLITYLWTWTYISSSYWLITCYELYGISLPCQLAGEDKTFEIPHLLIWSKTSLFSEIDRSTGGGV